MRLIRNLTLGLVWAFAAMTGLFELGAVAAPAQTQAVIVATVSQVTAVVAPAPTSVPVVTTVDVPSPIPTIVPIPSPIPSPTPQEFPSSPPALVVPTPGATPTQIAVPQTAVFVSANVQGDQHCPCPAPLTIQWVANFQGGFNGVTPTFVWSDGATGATDTVTYTTPGTYHSPTVQAYEVYQGVTYMVGTANANIEFTVI